MSQVTLTQHDTEKDFMQSVLDLARLLGWRAHHTRPARTENGWRTPIQGDAGFPDLVLARRGRVIFAELKSETGRVSQAQGEWLGALSACPTVEVYLRRPSDWAEAERMLR